MGKFKCKIVILQFICITITVMKKNKVKSNFEKTVCFHHIV